MASGPALPFADVWITWAQRATKTAPLFKPGDELTTKLWHAGDMLAGKIVVSIETSNSCGEKALQGAAEVAQPATVYVFTGQGLQEPGMCMLLRALFGKAQLPACLQVMATLPQREGDSFQRN
jgi:hypothetical protein